MGLYTQFFLYATAFLMLLNTFLVAGSLIVPFWIKIEIPGQAIRKGIFWECYNSTTLSATCKKLIFIDRVCPGTLPMVEASQLRLRYYAMRGLLITAIATSFLACISCILIALLRRRPTYSLWIPFGFILSTLCLIGPAILLYYYTEYRYANCHSIPCNGISSCRSSIAASWVMVLFAAFTCLTLTFLTCFAACWPFCCSMSRETKRKELLTQGLPPVEKPRYPELVIGRAPITAHSTMRSALKREMTDLTAWSEDKAPKRAHAAVMSDIENSSEEEHNVRMGSWNSTHSGTTHPRPPFALPNRKPTSNGVDPVRRVVTEPFGEITRIPRRTDSELPPKEELEEAATENDTAPRSREWAFDRESGLYWSKRQEVYYDDYSGHFYDPQVEKWFDPVTSEWYELD